MCQIVQQLRYVETLPELVGFLQYYKIYTCYGNFMKDICLETSRRDVCSRSYHVAYNTKCRVTSSQYVETNIVFRLIFLLARNKAYK